MGARKLSVTLILALVLHLGLGVHLVAVAQSPQPAQKPQPPSEVLITVMTSGGVPAKGVDVFVVDSKDGRSVARGKADDQGQFRLNLAQERAKALKELRGKFAQATGIVDVNYKVVATPDAQTTAYNFTATFVDVQRLAQHDKVLSDKAQKQATMIERATPEMVTMKGGVPKPSLKPKAVAPTSSLYRVSYSNTTAMQTCLGPFKVPGADTNEGEREVKIAHVRRGPSDVKVTFTYEYKAGNDLEIASSLGGSWATGSGSVTIRNEKTTEVGWSFPDKRSYFAITTFHFHREHWTNDCTGESWEEIVADDHVGGARAEDTNDTLDNAPCADVRAGKYGRFVGSTGGNTEPEKISQANGYTISGAFSLTGTQLGGTGTLSLSSKTHFDEISTMAYLYGPRPEYYRYDRGSSGKIWYVTGCDVAAPSATPGPFACDDSYEANNSVIEAQVFDPSRTHAAFCVPGDEDWIELPVATDATNYRIETYNLASGVDTVLELYRSDGVTLIAAADEGGDTYGASRITATLNRGTYYIKIRDYYGRGDTSRTFEFSVVADSTPYEPNGNASLAKPFSVGTTESHVFWIPGDVDWVKFTAAAGTNYTIETLRLAPELDTVLELYRDDGTTLVTAADEGGDTYGASRITQMLNPGTYYVKVREYRGRGGTDKTYDLRIITDTSDQYEPDGLPALAAPVLSTDNRAASQAHTFGIGGDVDWVKFTAVDGTNYTIETLGLGPEVDTVLELYRSDGTTLVAAADEGGDTYGASRITLMLDAGTYFVKVREYRARGGLDKTYHLRIVADTSDQYEPDGIIARATPVLGSSYQHHAFGVSGDVDWLKLSVAGSSTYTLETLNLAQSVDTVLELYRSDGTTLVAAADEGGDVYGASRIKYPLDAGTYYIKVREYRARGGSAYTYDLNIYPN